MNLYKLHSDPTSLEHYEDANEYVPKLVWERTKNLTNILRNPYVAIYAKDPKVALDYAMTINKPFPRGEDAIAETAETAYEYARHVLHTEFSKGEDAIAANSKYAFLYCKLILEKPWPKGEDAIAKDAEYAYKYALGVLYGPFPKGEKAIASEAMYAFKYAKDILHEPFPEGEKVILDSQYSIEYQALCKLNFWK